MDGDPRHGHRRRDHRGEPAEAPNCPPSRCRPSTWASRARCLFTVYLGAVEVGEAYGIQKSFLVLFMIIIGGLGSIFGSFAGAAFMVLLPVALKVLLVDSMGWDTAIATHFQFVVVGFLIMFFLIVEPHGLARLWQLLKEKLRLWPFPH
jgi:branched-chain amino acid transport system permease protein